MAENPVPLVESTVVTPAVVLNAPPVPTNSDTPDRLTTNSEASDSVRAPSSIVRPDRRETSKVPTPRTVSLRLIATVPRTERSSVAAMDLIAVGTPGTSDQSSFVPVSLSARLTFTFSDCTASVMSLGSPRAVIEPTLAATALHDRFSPAVSLTVTISRLAPLTSNPVALLESKPVMAPALGSNAAPEPTKRCASVTLIVRTVASTATSRVALSPTVALSVVTLKAPATSTVPWMSIFTLPLIDWVAVVAPSVVLATTIESATKDAEPASRSIILVQSRASGTLWSEEVPVDLLREKSRLVASIVIPSPRPSSVAPLTWATIAEYFRLKPAVALAVTWA